MLFLGLGHILFCVQSHRTSVDMSHCEVTDDTIMGTLVWILSVSLRLKSLDVGAFKLYFILGAGIFFFQNG